MYVFDGTTGMLCSTRVRGIEVELTSLLGTPVAICSSGRNEVQIPSQRLHGHMF